MNTKSNLLPYKEVIENWLLEEPDITWVQIAERLSQIKEKRVTESAVRRFCSANNLKKNVPAVEVDSSVIARVKRELDGEKTTEDQLRDEIDGLREKYKEAEQIIKRFKEKESFESKIEMTVKETLSSHDFKAPALAATRFKGNKSDEHEFLLMISDAHYGEVVNPEEALGLQFDPEVCRKRLEHMRDVTIRLAELKESAYPIRKITMASLGDMVGGIIHDELEVTNHNTMVEQTADMAHILYNMATDFSQVFPDVELIVKVGNHPRLHKKPRYKNKFDNWEFMMGTMIKGMADAANANIKVTVPKDLVYIHDIFDYRVAMVHGDGVKSNSFAGIPFYGLRNQREAVQALMSQTGHSRVDMFMMGHFHQYVYWSGECDIIINGSIKGGDEYGIGSRLSAPDPEQILLEWHPRHKVTSKNIIKLKDIK